MKDETLEFTYRFVFLTSLTRRRGAGHAEVLLQKCKVLGCDVIGLQETRRPGRTEFATAGYRVFCSGVDGRTGRAGQHGVGLAVQESIIREATWTQELTNERLMSMTFNLTGKSNAVTFIVAYGPIDTVSNTREQKAVFWADLESAVSRVSSSDYLFVLIDANARTGVRMGEEDCKVIGAYGRDTRVSDSNGTSLLRFAGDNKLALVNNSSPSPRDARLVHSTVPGPRIGNVLTISSRDNHICCALGDPPLLGDPPYTAGPPPLHCGTHLPYTASPPPLSLHREIPPPPTPRNSAPPARSPPPQLRGIPPPPTPQDPLRFLHRGTHPPPYPAGPTHLPTPRDPPPFLHRGIPPPPYTTGPTPIPTPRETPPTPWDPTLHRGIPPPPHRGIPPTPRDPPPFLHRGGPPPTPWDPTLHREIPPPLHRGIPPPPSPRDPPPYTAGSPPYSGISPYTAVFSFCLGEPSTPPPLHCCVFILFGRTIDPPPLHCCVFILLGRNTHKYAREEKRFLH